MRTKTYLLLLLVTGVISLGCAYLLLQYLNPEKNFLVAYTAMGISAVLASMSFIAIVLHFIKHLWYRGEVFSAQFAASVRQALFLSLAAFGSVVFFNLSILRISTVGLLCSTLLFLELVFQSMSRK